MKKKEIKIILFECFNTYTTLKQLIIKMFLRWAKQIEAFEYLDGLIEQQQQQQQNITIINKTHNPFLVLCEENTDTGKRCFITTKLQDWLTTKMFQLSPTQRHFYEIIRENSPCRLYLDLEFPLPPPPPLQQHHQHHQQSEINNLITKGKQWCKTICYHIATIIRNRYNIYCSFSNFLILDSSSEVKFSRHVILHLPNDPNCLFVNNQVVGIIVKEAVNHAKRCGDELAANIVDVKVYTKNRAFRTCYSSKQSRKSAILEPARDGEFFIAIDENSTVGTIQLMFNSLCAPFGAVQKSTQGGIQLLTDCEISNENILVKLPPSVITNKSTTTTTNSTSSSSSPYPIVDTWITQIASSMTTQPVAAIRNWKLEDNGTKIRFNIAFNRYCYNIGRQHRSNHVYYILDLITGIANQGCTDPECGGFRSSGFQCPFTSILLTSSSTLPSIVDDGMDD
jgi:hypothetical protein